jgi:predicted phage gp36 major capsid-like protein
VPWPEEYLKGQKWCRRRGLAALAENIPLKSLASAVPSNLTTTEEIRAFASEAILFGDIGTAYRIVDRIDLSVLVNPYLLATNSTTRMHASRRVGGAVVQPNAIKKLKMATS